MLPLSLALLGALAASPTVSAFFRMPCDNPVVVERADPIINPGAISGHTHTILGGSNFALNSTYDDMVASECTSCRAKADKSAYWTPQLYFAWANGSFSSVPQVGGGLVYYLPRAHPTDKTEVLAFPKGFKMLAGSPMRRTYNDSNLVDQAIGWNCLGSASPTRNPWLPKVKCSNGLRGEVRFPSCWNGEDLYKTDQSHVAYSQGESGPCPASHPKRLVTIFYEVMYAVDAFDDYWGEAKNPSSPFVLANGDPFGYGYHGDFLNGWDVDILQKAVRECTDDSGVIEDCPVLELYDRATDGYCRKTPDVNEVVLGTLPKLPGCNPLTTTTEDAQGAMKSCPDLVLPPIFEETTVYTGDLPPPGANTIAGAPKTLMSSTGYKYMGCYSDSGARSLPKQLTIETKTVASCLTAAKQAGYTIAGLEYGGECWAGNKLGTASKEIDYSKCNMKCGDASDQICGGPSALSLYNLGSKQHARRGKTPHA
ncbi:hypothetical protein JCM10908_002183 [Rhodotorula pacifica]|uniref:DUF1996 and WSC domain-containing protein n=1 Tax=Rhodotorula pacifica TaxID=1495444 RepID=UPI00316F841D